MKSVFLFLAAIVSMSFMNNTAAIAGPPDRPITVAVFGDWPYSATLLDNAPLLLNSVNNDPDVSLVIHVGDLHSGSMPCPEAGLNPIPAGSVPGWNQGVFGGGRRGGEPRGGTPGGEGGTDGH